MPQSSIQLPPALLSLLLSSSTRVHPGNQSDCGHAYGQRRIPIPGHADRPTSYIPVKNDRIVTKLDCPTSRVNHYPADIQSNVSANSSAFAPAPSTPALCTPRLTPCTTNSQQPTTISPLLQLLLQQGGIPQQPQPSAPLPAPVQPHAVPPQPTALPPALTQPAMPPPMSAPAAAPEPIPLHASGSSAAMPYNTQLLNTVVSALLAQSQGQPAAPPQPVPSASVPLVSVPPAAAAQAFSVPHSAGLPPTKAPVVPLHAPPQQPPVTYTSQQGPTPCETAVHSGSAQISSEQFSEQSATESVPRDLPAPTTVDRAFLQALLAAQSLQAHGNPSSPVGPSPNAPQAVHASPAVIDRRVPQGPMHAVLPQQNPMRHSPPPSVAAALRPPGALVPIPQPSGPQAAPEPSHTVKLLLGILAQHAQTERQQTQTQPHQPPVAAYTPPQPQQTNPPARLNPLQAPTHALHALPQDGASQPSLAHVLAQALRATHRPPHTVAAVGSPNSSITVAAPPLAPLQPQHATAPPARSTARPLQSTNSVPRPPALTAVAPPTKASSQPAPASPTSQDEQHVSSLTALLKTLQSCAKDEPEPVHAKHALPQHRRTAARGTHAVQRGSVQKTQHASKPTRPRSRLSHEKKGDKGGSVVTHHLTTAPCMAPSPTHATDKTMMTHSVGKRASQCVVEAPEDRTKVAPARQATACMSPKQMHPTAVSSTQATEAHPLRDTAAPDNALGGFAAAVLAATGAVRGAHRRVPSSPGAMHEHHESAVDVLEGSSDLTRHLSCSVKREAAPSPGPAGSSRSHKRSRFEPDDPSSLAAASPSHPHKRNTHSNILACADSAPAGGGSSLPSHLGEYLKAAKPSAISGGATGTTQAPQCAQHRRGAPKFWKQRLSRRASTGALRLTPDGGTQGHPPRKRAEVQCKELRRAQSAEPCAVSRPGKHPMHEAEATILHLFAKRGYKGACLKGRLLAQAVVHRRLGVLLPPSKCSDSMHGCVVHHENLPTPGNVVSIQGCATEEEAEAKAIDALNLCHGLSEQGISGPRVVAELQRRGLCSIPLESTSQDRAACMQSMD